MASEIGLLHGFLMNHRDFARDYFYSENQIENKMTQNRTHKSLNVKRDYFDIFFC